MSSQKHLRISELPFCDSRIKKYHSWIVCRWREFYSIQAQCRMITKFHHSLCTSKKHKRHFLIKLCMKEWNDRNIVTISWHYGDRTLPRKDSNQAFLNKKETTVLRDVPRFHMTWRDIIIAMYPVLHFVNNFRCILRTWWELDDLRLSHQNTQLCCYVNSRVKSLRTKDNPWISQGDSYCVEEWALS